MVCVSVCKIANSSREVTTKWSKYIFKTLRRWIEMQMPLCWRYVVCFSYIDVSESCDVNSLMPGRCPAIICTHAGILLIRTLGTNFNEVLSEIHAFSFKKMHLKISSERWWPFCIGLKLLRYKREYALPTEALKWKSWTGWNISLRVKECDYLLHGIVYSSAMPHYDGGYDQFML